jgi:hypothetical protein
MSQKRCDESCCLPDRYCCGNSGRLRLLCRRKCCLGTVVITLLVFEIFTFLIGLGFLISLSIDGRKNNIETFNAAVEKWPSKALSFVGLNVSITGTGGTLLIPPVTIADTYPDIADNVILPTVSIHYQTIATQTTPILSPLSFSDGAVVSLSLNINGTISIVSPKLFLTRTRSVSNGKSTRSETYYVRLSGLCYTILPSLYTSSGSGCSPDGSESLYTPFNKDDITTFNIPIDIRSIYDPYVIAMALTGGTLFFGVSMIMKVIIGSIMFSIGSITLYLTHIYISKLPAPFLVSQDMLAMVKIKPKQIVNENQFLVYNGYSYIVRQQNGSVGTLIKPADTSSGLGAIITGFSFQGELAKTGAQIGDRFVEVNGNQVLSVPFENIASLLGSSIGNQRPLSVKLLREEVDDKVKK